MVYKTKFIADIGSNHNNNLQRIEKLIYEAKELGFWAVKFQLFRAEYLYWNGAEKEYYNAIKNELDLDLVFHIKEICDDCNMRLLFTPFDKQALNFLIDNKFCKNIKISSFDILRKDFIADAYDKTDETLFISTGLATFGDIHELINYISEETTHVQKTFSLLKDICLMHCVSKYPTKKKESNIHKVGELRTDFSLKILHFGYSDHTVNKDVIKAAIKLKADFIELHLDLNDKKGNEYKYGHCWTMRKIKRLFNEIKNGSSFINNLKYHQIINKFGIAKPLTKDELGQRADPSDGLRPMLYKRVKKSS